MTNLKIPYFLIFILSFSLSAQDIDSVAISQKQELIYDLDSQHQVHEFDKSQIEDFKAKDDFNYTEYKEPDNWWTQLKNWVAQLFMKLLHWLFGTSEATGFWAVLLKILPYLVVVGVLFLLGWLFMKVNPNELLLENTELPQVALTDDEDIIQNQDIQELIQQALKNNNYRLAIRYYYLFVLKKLSDAEYIIWESQKTNTDYAKELKDSKLKNQFKVITRLYDFIWYGSFEVNENAYQRAEKEFLSITHNIQN